LILKAISTSSHQIINQSKYSLTFLGIKHSTILLMSVETCATRLYGENRGTLEVWCTQKTVMKCQNILQVLIKFNFWTSSWFVWYCLCM